MTPAQAQRLATVGPVARLVFALLAEAETPLTAYELLWRLQTRRGKSSPPSTIYRSLNALIDVGLAHRVASLNAFVVCTLAGEQHAPLFMICEECGSVREADIAEAAAQVRADVERAHFKASRFHFDIRGVCAACRATNGG
jgi:Fur family zinc uptake transcriptional regulator